MKVVPSINPLYWPSLNIDPPALAAAGLGAVIDKSSIRNRWGYRFLLPFEERE